MAHLETAMTGTSVSSWVSSTKYLHNLSLGSLNTSMEEDDTETEEVIVKEVVFGILSLCLLLLGCVGNGVVVVLVWRNPSMRSAINMLLSSLALCDVLISCFCMPLDFIALAASEWVLPWFLCQAHTILLSTLLAESSLLLLAISVDRYLIIVHRQDRLTLRLTHIFIFASWSGSLLLGVIPLMGMGGFLQDPLPDGVTHCEWRPADEGIAAMDYAYVEMTLSFVLPMIIMTFCFGTILNSVRHSGVRISIHPNGLDVASYTQVVKGPTISIEEDVGSSSSSFSSSSSSFPVSPFTIHNPRISVDIRYKTRTFKTILQLFVAYVVCRLPYMAFQLVQRSRNWSSGPVNVAYIYVLWFFYLNQIINPLVYWLRIKKYREAVYDYFPFLLHILPGLDGEVLRRLNPGSVYMISSPRSTSRSRSKN